MNKQDTYLLNAFRSLGEIISHKDAEISVLNYEVEKLKEKLESIEEYVNRLGGNNEIKNKSKKE